MCVASEDAAEESERERESTMSNSLPLRTQGVLLDWGGVSVSLQKGCLYGGSVYGGNVHGAHR